MMNLSIFLVNHPILLNFAWVEGQTFGSSPFFLIFTIFSYLSLTFLLSHIPFPSISPQFLKAISSLHNFILLILYFIMAIGCTLSSIYHVSHPLLLICFPPQTPPIGPLFFWAYIFYLSKILELLDTLLIILSRSYQRLTFLHLYHHSMVLIMSYLWLSTSQSLISIGIVVNAIVHIIMYGYYFLCSIGIKPKWKKLVTNCQILQFVFALVVSGWMLYEHFGRSSSLGGCSGMKSWCFSIVFVASLLALFIDFHSKSYVMHANTNKNNKTL
ncbi:elongation of fatty acids protein 3-like [Benincasa hispida]|uniref:elongation of fatty acids protein 3-like n=1 Tax=Benincasa hispida TaxID=102211 RepID=UPI001901B790|nr:elongation of fatty acids protein 3-like [Benincasa hispida]